MTALNTIKISNFNEIRKSTHKKINNLLSQLEGETDSAISQQAYMRKNPHDNGASELISEVTPAFTATAAAFNAVAAKLQDMQLVAAGSMTVDELITKYSVDLAGYSEQLL